MRSKALIASVTAVLFSLSACATVIVSRQVDAIEAAMPEYAAAIEACSDGTVACPRYNLEDNLKRVDNRLRCPEGLSYCYAADDEQFNDVAERIATVRAQLWVSVAKRKEREDYAIIVGPPGSAPVDDGRFYADRYMVVRLCDEGDPVACHWLEEQYRAVSRSLTRVDVGAEAYGMSYGFNPPVDELPHPGMVTARECKLYLNITNPLQTACFINRAAETDRSMSKKTRTWLWDLARTMGNCVSGDASDRGYLGPPRIVVRGGCELWRPSAGKWMPVDSQPR